MPVPPIRILEFVVCDLMWLWIIIGSSAAAVLASRRYPKNKLPMVISFGLPVGIALTVYPVIGLLTAVVEIAYLSYPRGRFEFSEENE